MADKIESKEAEARLWKEIDDRHMGMLGVVGGKPHHFQPMTPFTEPDSRTIWFMTRDDTDLVHQATDGKAMFIVQAKDFQACIGGTLTVTHDRARIDKFWNAVVAAWYPDGKDDPHLTMLRFDCDDAQLWLSEAGPVRFAFEIAKANITGKQPDVGDRAHLNLG